MTKSTYFGLLAEFETAQIPLADLCTKYFNLSIDSAKRKAALQKLPVPVIKIRDGQKSGYFILAGDLAAYIDEQADHAREEWKKVNC